MNLELPAKLLFLMEPHRYKVAHGGRGGAKSWAFARALLTLGSSRRMRILCTREVQKSIKDSVKKLLDDQIQLLGLNTFYESYETEIRGRNGTEILFAGLAQHTVESVKSYESIDICWVEEAQAVSKKSWDILTPTIRKEGSEIWVSFNPVLDTDEVWTRFVVNPPPDSVVVQINYHDNPWFSTVLEQERKHCETTSPEDYPNIWEGKCRSSVVGAIYANEMSAIAAEGRICPVPYNPRLKVHVIYDLGWNDSMTLILVQRIGPNALGVINYIEDSFRTLDSYAAELNAMQLNWGFDYLPHDGKTKDFKTGQSAAEILARFGRQVRDVPQIGVEPGIRMARMTLPRTYFDKVRTTRLIECLKRYRRGVPASTGEPGSPVHDEFSHGADAFRYLSVVAEQLTNEDERSTYHPLPQYSPNVMGTGL